jgi:hypothetical protein
MIFYLRQQGCFVTLPDVIRIDIRREITEGAFLRTERIRNVCARHAAPDPILYFLGKFGNFGWEAVIC